MGCQKSKLCEQRHELEIDLQPDDSVMTEPLTTRRIPHLLLESIEFEISPKKVQSQSKILSLEHDSTKNTKWEVTASIVNSSLFNSLQPIHIPNTTALDVQIRIGKTSEQLTNEFSSIENSLKKLLELKKLPVNISASIFKRISAWNKLVYTPIVKKTTEIKSAFTYSYSLTDFTMSHEVVGWDDLELLLAFCNANRLRYDPTFFRRCHRKIGHITTLSLVIALEISLVEEKDKYGKVRVTGVDYYLTVYKNKPLTLAAMHNFLVGCPEQENLSMWFKVNDQICGHFGFGINVKDDLREIQIGCHIFGEEGKYNLAKAIHAFKSYGATFSLENLDVIKAMPRDEFWLVFFVSESGVTRIRMAFKAVEQKCLKELLNSFQQNCKLEEIRKSIGLLGEGGDSKQQESAWNFLEFSAQGFKLGCEVCVGKEYGSFIYLDA